MAADLDELLRVRENTHRMWIAESYLRHVMFRKESRWPSYSFCADFPEMDDKKWKSFFNEEGAFMQFVC